jgi:two-component system, LytTR family, response regulator
MMKLNLICSKNIRLLLEEIMKDRHLLISDDADIVVIEKGFDLEVGKTGIYFDSSSLESLINLLDLLSAEKADPHNFVTAKSGKGEFKVIGYQDILYFEALGKDVFCTDGIEQYKVKEKLFSLEEKLKAVGFIRVSKSYIVNISAIDRIVPWFNSTLLLKMVSKQPDIIVTRNYLNYFKDYLNM